MTVESELADDIPAYDAIAAIWNIPRHRVKTLITAGCYGLGGSRKSFEEWQTQLRAWDAQYAPPTDTITAPVMRQSTTKTGRFVSSVKDILRFSGKKK